MPIRRISKEEADQNRKKQQILKNAGYNINIDGSWGPWQEKQYKKVTVDRRQPNQASALAIPLYGIAQALQGTSTVSLPTLSSSAIAAAPIITTLAGPISGITDLISGIHRYEPVTRQQRQERTFAPDATRVTRPISNAESIHIDPALVRKWAVDMASNESDNTAESDNTETSTASSSTETPQTPDNGDNKQKKEGFISKLINKSRNKKSNQNKQQNTDSDGFLRGTKRFLWETAKNNYNKDWRWRNAVRALLSPITVPAAFNLGSRILGFYAGMGSNISQTAIDNFQQGYQSALRRDTAQVQKGVQNAPIDTTRFTYPSTTPITSPTQDSILTQDSVDIDFNQDYKW